MNRTPLNSPARFFRPRRIIQLCILGAVIVLAVTQYRLVLSGFQVMRSADVGLACLAAVVFIASIIPCALSYQALSLVPLRPFVTLLVQVAAGFTNTLLPAGLGGLGLYAAYLHAQGHTVAQSAAIVAANNVIGFVGSIVLVCTVITMHPEYFLKFSLPAVSIAEVSVIVVPLAIALFGLLLYVRVRHGSQLRQHVADQLQALRASLKPNRRTLYSLLSNMALTLLKSLVLAIVTAAVGAGLGWPAALLVLSVGTLAGATVPTPGGLGGVEAGLLAGCIAFGTAPALALAAVLLYRFLTYIVPMVPGVFAFRLARPYLSADAR